ncbi:D-alanyl-D-alanine carboxypeptidase family protein [Thioclava sp. GXIMD2076]|uniref:D-alanyl-D-alanine carboxypeptidase family protein n=1 Tax=Thioclava sp. GXIMD2076 TaxID=3131931 RepID=UPI0030CF03B6
MNSPKVSLSGLTPKSLLTGAALLCLALGTGAGGAPAAAQEAAAPLTAEQAPVTALPGAPEAPALPDVASYVLMDAQTGTVLASKGAGLLRAPASLTKMMTAYLTYQALAQGRVREDQVVPVSNAAWKATGSRMFLDPSAKVTIHQLLHGLIIQSGNDAAVALAEAVGGSQEAFVLAMNAEAKTLGLADTHYTNVSGLPQGDIHTSALDVAKLSHAIIRDYPQFLEISAQKEYTFDNITQRSWNPVLFKDASVDGLKTGLTDAAGHCIAATASRNGRRLIAVEMGAPDWDSGTTASEVLLDYGYHFFENAQVVTAGTKLGELDDPRFDPEQIPVGAAEDMTMSVPSALMKSVETTVSFNPQIPEELPAGARVGTITYSSNGTVLAQVPAVTLTKGIDASFMTKIMRKLHSAL